MTCKHNWNFVDGLTKRIRCTRCAAMEFVNPQESLTIPDAGYSFHDHRPNNIIFYNTAGGAQVEVLRISQLGITANPDIPTDEAADAVLRALDGHIKGLVQKAKEALAQPEQQEPVAEIVSDAVGCLSTKWRDDWTPNEGDKLYTTPPQRTWVGLTNEELSEAMEYWSDDERSAYGGAYAAEGEYFDVKTSWRYIEAKLKEKNT